MNTTAESSLLCRLGTELAEGIMQFVLMYKIIACAMGVLLTIIAIVIEWHRWVLNINAKVIFYFHMLLTLVSPIAHFLPLAFDYIRLTDKPESTCGYVLSERTAFLVSVAALAISCLQSATMIALCCERLLATIWSKHYERISNCWLGIGLTFVFVIIYSGMFYLLLVWDNDFSGQTCMSSVITGSNRNRAVYICIINCAVEFVAVVAFFVLKRYNNRRVLRMVASPGKSLSFRYQIRENLRIITLLIPLFVCHFVLTLTSAAPQVVFHFDLIHFNTAREILITEAFDELILYSVLVSCYIIVGHLINSRVGGAVNVSQTQADNHFNQLDDIWTKRDDENRL